jgi:hypothetical protein
VGAKQVIRRGDKVLWLKHDMPGKVVDLMDGDIQIEWEPGHDNEFSGGTYWGGAAHLARGLIELVGENGKPKVPETLIDPTGRDLFAEAGQLLLFEMS